MYIQLFVKNMSPQKLRTSWRLQPYAHSDLTIFILSNERRILEQTYIRIRIAYVYRRAYCILQFANFQFACIFTKVLS